MIPQIASRLIERYVVKDGLILDPFCGSGTTLVEATLHGHNSKGNDINAFAILLSKVKSNPLDLQEINFNANYFMNQLRLNFDKAKKLGNLPAPPDILPNFYRWFKAEAAVILEFLYHEIEGIHNEALKDFLKIIFSNTVRKSSNIDHRSSNFIRTLPEIELKYFHPDVSAIFEKELIDGISRMSSFYNRVKDFAGYPHSEVIYCDTRKLTYKEKFDAIITSPPYGEEKNTIGYARWSRPYIAWLRLNGESIQKEDKHALGSKTSKDVQKAMREIPSKSAAIILLSSLIILLD
jgi:site-specific DNA-methyltransferase (cytosine-N4-specific)